MNSDKAREGGGVRAAANLKGRLLMRRTIEGLRLLRTEPGFEVIGDARIHRAKNRSVDGRWNTFRADK